MNVSSASLVGRRMIALLCAACVPIAAAFVGEELIVMGELRSCQIISINFCSALNSTGMTSGQPRRLEFSVKSRDALRDTCF